jgi:hypothetical protein
MTAVVDVDPGLPRQIIFTLVDQLRTHIVPLTSKALAPTHFVVYLHPDDHLQLAGISAAITDEASRAMDAEIARMSRWSRPLWRRLLYRVLRPWAVAPPLPIDGAPTLRHIELLPDPDGDIPRSSCIVRTQLPAPGPTDYAGTATVSVSPANRTEGATQGRTSPTLSRLVYGRLEYRDDEGQKLFDICDDTTLVGRGGSGCWVHAKIRAGVEISQEHVRIRRDPQTGQFFIKDLSRNGTTLNGQRIPAGVVYEGDVKREIDHSSHEVPLPARAQIGLAGLVTMSFSRTER